MCGSDLPTSESIFSSATYFFFHAARSPSGPEPTHYRGFVITLRHTTLGRTPLDEWSARRRDLYWTAQCTHNRQTSMPLVGFEPEIPAAADPHLRSRGHSSGYLKIWRPEVLHSTITLPVGLCSSESWSLVLNEGRMLKVQSVMLWVSQNAM